MKCKDCELIRSEEEYRGIDNGEYCHISYYKNGKEKQGITLVVKNDNKLKLINKRYRCQLIGISGSYIDNEDNECLDINKLIEYKLMYGKLI